MFSLPPPQVRELQTTVVRDSFPCGPPGGVGWNDRVCGRHDYAKDVAARLSSATDIPGGTRVGGTYGNLNPLTTVRGRPTLWFPTAKTTRTTFPRLLP